MSLYCEKCRVTVAGSHSRCPLCQGMLLGEPDAAGDRFPFLDTIMHRYNLLIRILFFLSGALLLSCFAVNYLLQYQGGFWSLYVAIGTVSIWASVRIILRKRHNIPKTILWQALLFSAVVMGVDALTGWHQWSLNYAVPIFFTVAIFALWAVAIIMRLRAEEYLVYLLMDLLIGAIPVILLGFKLVKVDLPAVLCALSSGISFIALLAFKDKALRSEVKKRLHL